MTDQTHEARYERLTLFASWLANIRDYEDNPHMLGPSQITLQDIIDRARQALGANADR